MTTTIEARAFPAIDYTAKDENGNYCDAQVDNPWTGAEEAKACLLTRTTLSNGQEIVREISSEIYERGDDMTDSDFRNACLRYANELKTLYRGVNDNE